MQIKVGDAGIYTDDEGKTARATVVKVRGGNRCDVEATGIPRSETQHVPMGGPMGTSPRHFLADGDALAVLGGYDNDVTTTASSYVVKWPPKPSPWAANRATVLAVVLGALATGLSLAGLLFR